MVTKNSTRKKCNIDNDFELYQSFIHSFLRKNVLIFPLYILLLRRIDTCWFEYMVKFWSRSTETFCRTEKQLRYWQRFLELYHFFRNCFISQTVPKSSVYIVPKLLTIWLTQFCVIIHPKLFISNLAYTTCTNPFYYWIWTKKYMIKWVNTTSFFYKNLNYKSTRNIMTP